MVDAEVYVRTRWRANGGARSWGLDARRTLNDCRSDVSVVEVSAAPCGVTLRPGDGLGFRRPFRTGTDGVTRGLAGCSQRVVSGRGLAA